MKSDEIRKTNITRRRFLKGSAVAATGFLVPTIVPASVFGADSPGNRITIGFVGVGRMGMGDLRELLGHKQAQIVAVCDVDANRTTNAQKTVEAHYAKQRAGSNYKGCSIYGDYRDLVARDDIDAVCVVTPDHWHALPSIAAAKAGKDIFLQKPLTLTIREGRVLSDTVCRYKRIF